MTTTLTSIATSAGRPAGEWYAGSLLHWHVVTPELTLGEALVRPGGEPPLHIHAREDETFYVLEGTIAFQRGLERMEIGAGESVYMPRGIQHAFAVRTPEARLLQLFTPGGLEVAFRAFSEPARYEALPPTPQGAPPDAVIEAMTAEFNRAGVEFVGPPLPPLLDA
jgi:quercetin dioxygenase-like cupin family protein